MSDFVRAPERDFIAIGSSGNTRPIHAYVRKSHPEFPPRYADAKTKKTITPELNNTFTVGDTGEVLTSTDPKAPRR